MDETGWRTGWVDWTWDGVEQGDPVTVQRVSTTIGSQQVPNTAAVDETPRTDCGRWLAAAGEFISLGDRDWYRMADL
jgi:hypothetical protein